MKKYLYGSALLLFLSLVLLQSTSFSNTELLTKATVSVTETQALVSVHYGEGRQFYVTNNTENLVHVRDNGSISPNESFQIGPGRSNSFTIIGPPEEIYESILLDVEWDDGYAIVESEIPPSNMEQILAEVVGGEGVIVLDIADGKEDITIVQEEQIDEDVSEEDEEDTSLLDEVEGESTETDDVEE